MKNTNNKRISVGLMGTSFLCANKGCEALAYSFLDILDKAAQKQKIMIDLYIFASFSYKTYFKWILKKQFRKGIIPSVIYSRCAYHLAPENQDIGAGLTKYFIARCDVIFDFTSGDSFTDLYGEKRYYNKIRYKNWVLDQNIPLVLGSQTYGPFKDPQVKKAAGDILGRSYEVFSRDNMSTKCVKELCGRKAISVTDVAFALPYSKNSREKKNRIQIGINISGLLWEGGYTRDNQFSLTVDYQKYCSALLDYLTEHSSAYEVHIIPHVFGTAQKGVYVADDDMIPYRILQELYPDFRFSPVFATPMDAKSYIAEMDVFIGARMHATIGAFSAGVATVPFSYSRKFEGLYESLGYPFTVKGTKCSTQEAVQQTIDYITNYKELRSESAIILKELVEQKLILLEEETSRILIDIWNGKKSASPDKGY